MALIFDGENYDTGRESGQGGSAAVQRSRRTLHPAARRLSGVHPGLKIRTKQNQIHQKKANNFGLFRPRALPQFVAFRLVFRPSLPKFCPRISRLLDLKLDILYAFVAKDTQLGKRN